MMKELVHSGHGPIGWLVRGRDGGWWLTLHGKVPTTLGPEWDREQLIQRGIRRWMKHNRFPSPPS